MHFVYVSRKGKDRTKEKHLKLTKQMDWLDYTVTNSDTA